MAIKRYHYTRGPNLDGTVVSHDDRCLWVCDTLPELQSVIVAENGESGIVGTDTYRWNGASWSEVTGGNPGSDSVATAALQDDAVTYAKLQNTSATDVLLGRSSVGAGIVEEVPCTSAGRALLDDADAAAQRTTLGLGSLATQSGTFSGTSSGTNTGDQVLPVKATGAEVDTGTDDAKFCTPKAIEDSSYIKAAYADAKVADAINNGTTTVAPSQNAVFDALAGKQDTLVSATNIKTINGSSLLGSGDLAVGGGNVFPIGAVFIAVVNTDPSTLLGYGTWSAFGAGRVLVGFNAGDADFDTVEETGGAKTHTLTSAEMPSHTHTQDSHNHTQDAHNHTQDAHTHTQNSHNHTQDAHSHIITSQTATTGGATSYEHGTLDTSSAEAEATETTATTVATNQAATATNQNATATNQAATATNQATTATNQNTGGGGAHNNLQPYIVVYFWKRTA